MVLFPRSGHRQKTCEKKASTLSRCATTNTCIHWYHHTLETQRAFVKYQLFHKAAAAHPAICCCCSPQAGVHMAFPPRREPVTSPICNKLIENGLKEAAISSNTSNTSSIITFSQLILKGHPESRQRCGDNQCSDSPPYHSPNPCNKSRCVELTSF